MGWLRRWLVERAARSIMKRLLKSSKKERGLLRVWNGLMLCCYDLHDDDSWEYSSDFRKSVRNETTDLSEPD